MNNSPQMGINSYQNINELLKTLESKLDQLAEGDLTLAELDDALNISRELYDRLLIIRHKAREKVVSEDEEMIVVEEIVEEVSVEELPQDEEKPAFDLSEEPEQPAFDFTFSEPIEEEVVAESEEEAEIADKSEPTAEPEQLGQEEVRVNMDASQQASGQDEMTLKDKLATDDELSLRKKLQSTPVSNLPKEISIAKKFEYISCMFNGDQQAYDAAIEVLNNCGSG